MGMLKDKVALVTGASSGLGYRFAQTLAAEGAVVAAAARSSDKLADLVSEIERDGGTAQAFAFDALKTEAPEALVEAVTSECGLPDILINNAGILRDKTFAKMDMADFRKVIEVHLMGTANVTHAVWPLMREAGYGRIVLTSSSSGLYGNFGQANYGAAKAAMMGLMNVLHIEGARDNIRVNTLAPTAATRMTESLMPPEALELLDPATITPGVLYLVSEDAPSRVILGAGAGSFAVTKVYETLGDTLTGDDLTPEGVAAAFEKISDPEGQLELTQAFHQTQKYTRNAAEAKGLKLDWG